MRPIVIYLLLLLSVCAEAEKTPSALGDSLYVYQVYDLTPEHTSLQWFAYDTPLPSAIGGEMPVRFAYDNSRIDLTHPLHRAIVSLVYVPEGAVDGSSNANRAGVVAIYREIHTAPNPAEPGALVVVEAEKEVCDTTGAGLSQNARLWPGRLCASYLPEPDLSVGAARAMWACFDSILAAKRDSVVGAWQADHAPVVLPDLSGQ